MRFFLILSMGVGALLLGACGGSQKSVGSESAPVSAEKVAAFIEDVLATGPTYGYDDVVLCLGAPVRVRAKAVTDLLEDTLRTVVYYGMELSFYDAGSSGPSYLRGIALTDARYTMPEGLRVGHARMNIRDYLGMPTREESTQLFYERAEPVPTLVVVTLEQHAVSRIEWWFEHEG